MARISTVYQPCKIKKDGYTNWIDDGKFCTTNNPDGTTTPPSSGSNLIDAFDVDWSAYTIDDLLASANAIISKLNEHLKQIDGEVTSWFMEGKPTTTNAPASDWTGTDENGVAFDYRQRHEGDTYTNINNATNKHLDNPDIWENGSSTSESGKSYDAVKTGLTTRIRTKELLRNNKSPKKIKVVAGYSVVIRYFDENKIQTTGSSDTWLSEFTLNPNYPYFALAFRKNDNSNITIDVLKSFTQSIFTVEGAFDYDPTAGQSWRWCNVDDEYGTGWHWHKIADSDALKALTIANGVREDFDNLEIGGVNLLPNTRTGVGFVFVPWATGCSGEFDSTNKWFKFTCPQNDVTGSLVDSLLLKSPTVLLTPGTYTVSFLYRSTLPLDRMQVLYLPMTSEGKYDNDKLPGLVDFKIKKDPFPYFQKYSATFNISEELRDAYGWIIRIDLDHRNAHETSQELYIKDIKLERGDKATDWSPALEDVEAEIVDAQSTADNALTLATEVREDFDNLEIGGRNLLRNSKIGNNLDWWSFSGAKMTLNDGVIHCVGNNGNYPRLYNTSLRGKTFELGATYMLSLWIRSSVNANRSIRIDDGNNTNRIMTFDSVPLTTEWQHLKLSAECVKAETTDKTVFQIWVGNDNVNGEAGKFDNTNWIEVKELKLEKGNKATDWTPAPEDVDSKADAIKVIADGAAAMEVGGRNLARGTKDMQLSSSNTWSKGTWRKTSYSTNIDLADAPLSMVEHGIRITCSADSSVTQVVQDNATIPFQVGDKLIVSCYAKPSVSGLKLECQPIWAYYNNTSGQAGLNRQQITLGNAGEWQKVVFDKIGSITIANDSQSLAYFYAIGSTTAYIDICAVKVEKGTKATDWTPALEDIEATLATKLDKITGTANNILYIGSADSVTSSSNLNYNPLSTFLSVPKINITRTDDWTNDELNPLQTQSVVIGGMTTGTHNLLFTRGAIQAGTKTESGYNTNTLYLNPEGGNVRIGSHFELSEDVTNKTMIIRPRNDSTNGSCVFDFANKCFRRNANSADMTLGSSTYKWANVYTNKITFAPGETTGIWNNSNHLLLGISPANPLHGGCENEGDVAVGSIFNNLVLRGTDIYFYDASAWSKRLFIFEDSTKWDEYLQLSGGTMTGALCFNQTNAKICFEGKGLKIYSPNQVNVTTSIEAPAFYLTSDIRLKNIKSELSLDKCYDLLDKCLTIIYSLKDQTQELIGMIAQEVEEFFPEVVATDADGFKSLAYDRLVVICLKVLKDVIKRLEKLEHE